MLDAVNELRVENDLYKINNTTRNFISFFQKTLNKDKKVIKKDYKRVEKKSRFTQKKRGITRELKKVNF